MCFYLCQARQELLRRGLFETDYRFYAKHGCFLATLFLSGLHLSLAAGYGSAAKLLGAALIGGPPPRARVRLGFVGRVMPLGQAARRRAHRRVLASPTPTPAPTPAPTLVPTLAPTLALSISRHPDQVRAGSRWRGWVTTWATRP